MASLLDMRRRIKSVKNTQQITKAMKMVAAAKLRRAQEGIISTRPYARKLGGLLRTAIAAYRLPATAGVRAISRHRNCR